MNADFPIPAGFALAPLEPIEAMLRAAVIRHFGQSSTYDDENPEVADAAEEQMTEVWRAMIAAAPPIAAVALPDGWAPTPQQISDYLASLDRIQRRLVEDEARGIADPAAVVGVGASGPSGDVPSDFQEGQWWLAELDKLAVDDDAKRAVSVVRNFMQTAHAQVATSSQALPAAQATAVMPCIGPLLDAWDALSAYEQTCAGKDLIEAMLSIERGMHVDDPAAQAAPKARCADCGHLGIACDGSCGRKPVATRDPILRAKLADLLHLLKHANIETPTRSDAAQALRLIKELRTMLVVAP